jgi:hypothetical protein
MKGRKATKIPLQEIAKLVDYLADEGEPPGRAPGSPRKKGQLSS